MEKQQIPGLKQAKYKVSIEEINGTKTDGGLSGGHENSLKGVKIGQIWENLSIRMNNRVKFDTFMMVLSHLKYKT